VISAAISTQVGAPRAEAVTPVVPLRAAGAAAQPAPEPAREPAPLATGNAASAAREPGAQQRLGRLQQGQAWLHKLDGDLRALAAALAGGADETAVASKLAQLQSSWAQRGDAGGLVDGQLRVQMQGDTRQQFLLRGLDAAALADAGNGRETLTLALPGAQRRVQVTLDPAAGAAANLQTLQRALAPAGIGVARQGDKLLMSVSESRWPALRQGMSLMGEGRRYPSGQLVRAPLEAQGDALRPAQWRTDSASGRQQLMEQLRQAHGQLQRGRQQVDAALDAAALPALGDAGEGAQLQAFADGFGREAPTELLPAVQGLGRQRVCQLLKPDFARPA
jgi:hypothetical protein